MKDRPILFSGSMVRAILAGTKTQTRRVVKLNPHIEFESYSGGLFFPKGTRLGIAAKNFISAPGDRLWVRETWSQPGGVIHYRADDIDHDEVFEWKPSIFMRREICRIMLEVVAVRAERLNEISETDALEEGGPSILGFTEGKKIHGWKDYRDWYRWLWNCINEARGFGWEKNPWVWVVEFKRIS